MHKNRRQFGLTLTELLVTIAVMAILMTLAVPAAKRLSETFHSGIGARGMINAALNNARAIAAREGTYAGIWFYYEPAEQKTYMVFIVYDSETTQLANGFCPVPGRKAAALPDGIIALDSSSGRSSFPVVFNAAGRLVIHPVRYHGILPFKTPTESYNSEEVMSVTGFVLRSNEDSAFLEMVLINPYTGELVGEE
jgi:prepilin-type N-terminal cleavage/methylation domain-containing protein